MVVFRRCFSFDELQRRQSLRQQVQMASPGSPLFLARQSTLEAKRQRQCWSDWHNCLDANFRTQFETRKGEQRGGVLPPFYIYYKVCLSYHLLGGAKGDFDTSTLKEMMKVIKSFGAYNSLNGCARQAPSKSSQRSSCYGGATRDSVTWLASDRSEERRSLESERGASAGLIIYALPAVQRSRSIVCALTAPFVDDGAMNHTLSPYRAHLVPVTHFGKGSHCIKEDAGINERTTNQPSFLV
nr:hypothetical protein Iba_chr14dCG13000 [Ipomoea batatas]